MDTFQQVFNDHMGPSLNRQTDTTKTLPSGKLRMWVVIIWNNNPILKE